MQLVKFRNKLYHVYFNKKDEVDLIKSAYYVYDPHIGTERFRTRRVWATYGPIPPPMGKTHRQVVAIARSQRRANAST